MPVIYTDLRDKVVLLSGVGQAPQDYDKEIWGNGAATASILAQNGARIFGCDLDLPSAELTKERVEQCVENADITVVQADVTKRKEVESVVEKCLTKYGRIDILVCNVGKSAPGGPAEMSDEVWQSQLDVNLTSAFLCTGQVLPIMEKQSSGSIILLSSIAGKGFAGRSHIGYSTTKAALVNMAQAIGGRYAGRNIRCNAVVPGLIHTPLVARLAYEYNNGDYEGLVTKRGNSVPMGRMGTAFDVANAIAFLASNEAAGYITGTQLTVDGGLTAVVGSSQAG
ncbi:hypothetical protein LTS08_006933 [Lithohypha guttulata]|nr:hypothetical protein LTS08_006933 [Lithohypha guttulata]